MLELGYKVSAAQSCPGGMHLLLLFHFALFFFPLFPLLLFFFFLNSSQTFTLLSSALFSSSLSRSCRQFAQPRYLPARASVYV